MSEVTAHTQVLVRREREGGALIASVAPGSLADLLALDAQARAAAREAQGYPPELRRQIRWQRLVTTAFLGAATVSDYLQRAVVCAVT